MKLIFNTLEEYDSELNKMNKLLNRMENRIQNHPENIGTLGNYHSMNHLYNIYLEDKQKFIKEMNKIKLNINGNINHNSLPEEIAISINAKFNSLTNNSLNPHFEIHENLHVTSITEGSYNITLEFENPNEDDVKRLSLRKKSLLKIFDLMDCGEDIEKLKKVAGPYGQMTLKYYKEFLYEIIKNNADLTINTEKGHVHSRLTLKQCENIHENLNIN